MHFPNPADFRLTVAGPSVSGGSAFLEVEGPATMNRPGVFTGALFWSVESGHSSENIGRPPDRHGMAGPNGSTFGVNCFPAHSAAKQDLGSVDTAASGIVSTGHGGDPAMHATNTIDCEAILSGKVDIELPGGKVRTSEPGDLLVMAGVPHAWKNRYDEDCIYIAVTVGFNRLPVNGEASQKATEAIGS